MNVTIIEFSNGTITEFSGKFQEFLATNTAEIRTFSQSVNSVGFIFSLLGVLTAVCLLRENESSSNVFLAVIGIVDTLMSVNFMLQMSEQWRAGKQHITQ